MGKLMMGNDIIADGYWSNDTFVSGKVRNKFYEGEWKDNAFNGKGTYKFMDGSYYKGDWRHNEKHGVGIYCYSNGDTY